MKTTPRSAINAVVEAVLGNRDVYSATKVLSPDHVTTLTRMNGPDGRNKRNSFMLTIGAPNYLGRKFAKACQDAGEPFPVRKVQLRFYPKKK